MCTYVSFKAKVPKHRLQDVLILFTPKVFYDNRHWQGSSKFIRSEPVCFMSGLIKCSFSVGSFQSKSSCRNQQRKLKEWSGIDGWVDILENIQ